MLSTRRAFVWIALVIVRASCPTDALTIRSGVAISPNIMKLRDGHMSLSECHYLRLKGGGTEVPPYLILDFFIFRCSFVLAHAHPDDRKRFRANSDLSATSTGIGKQRDGGTEYLSAGNHD